MRRLIVVLVIMQTIAPPAAWAWNAHGHRTITYLALDTLPAEVPAWMRDRCVERGRSLPWLAGARVDS